MSTTLRGDGISFGGPMYNQQGSDTETNTYQRSTPAVVKIGFGSGAVNMDGSGGAGLELDVTDAQLNMGVPQKANNLYRIWYQTVSDDWDGSTSGVGLIVYRHTPSAGWVKVLAQGSHSSYDSNLSDFYRTNNFLCYVPVHPTYPTEEHSFKFAFNKHNTARVRINCSIGADTRQGGHQNNTFEIWEMDGDMIATTGSFSTNW